MNIKCPNCQQEYDVAENDLGKKAECDKCKTSFIIEHPKLIKCSACEKVVSREAISCLHCGQPIKNSFELSKSIIRQTDETSQKNEQRETREYEFIKNPIPDENSSNKPKFNNNSYPSGVEGWLRLFCVILTIGNPILAGSQCFYALNFAIKTLPYSKIPEVNRAIIWESSGSLALIIYGFIAGVMIWNKNPNGRDIAKTFLLISLIGGVIIKLTALIFVKNLPRELLSYFFNGIIIYIPTGGISFLIWWFYFKKSKRVRNTYGT